MARMIKIPAGRLSIPRLPDINSDDPEVYAEMTLQEHLVELRDRLVKVGIGIVLGFIVGFIVQGRILAEIAAIAQVGDEGLLATSPTDPLMMSFRIALYVAIAITMPLIVYQSIAFLAPGLSRKEKRFVFMSLPFVSALFLLGVFYAYILALPQALGFLSRWNADVMQWNVRGQETLTFFLTLMIGLGTAFQLPVIMFIVAKIGLLTPPMMRKWRKYAFLAILILSALITPTTDPITMMVVATPLYILYELGIVISSVFAKTTLRESAGSEEAIVPKKS